MAEKHYSAHGSQKAERLSKELGQDLPFKDMSSVTYFLQIILPS
jgi:hypothetical protein